MIRLIQPLYYPQPYQDESPIGYLMRVAKCNGYPSYQWLVKDTGRIGSNEPIYLLRALIKTPWSGYEEIKHNLLPVCGLNAYRFNTATLRYCPHCLRESSYYRVNWQLVTSTICVKHRCWLIDECEHSPDSEGFDLSCRDHKFGQCCCGMELTEAKTRRASNAAIKVQRFLDGVYQESDPIWFASESVYKPDGLEIRLDLTMELANWQLINSGAFSSPGYARLPRFRKMRVVRPLIETLAETLFASRKKFSQYLYSLHNGVHDTEEEGDALFNRFYKKIYTKVSADMFGSLIEELEQYISDHWTHALSKRNSLFSDLTINTHPWLPFQQACRNYDIRKSVLRRAIADNEVKARFKDTEKRKLILVSRVDVQKFVDQQTGTMNSVAAATMLGVTKKQFYMLLDCELLIGGVPPSESYSGHWEFSETVLSRFLDVYVNQHPLVECGVGLRFPDAIRCIGAVVDEPFISLMNAIRSNRIKANRTTHHVGLRSLVFKEDELKTWRSERSQEQYRSLYTPQMLCTELGLSFAFINQILDEGLIDFHRQANNKRRLIKGESLLYFKDRYVLLPRIAKLLRQPNSQIIKKLAVCRVRPIKALHHGSASYASQYVYLRKQVRKVPAFCDLIDTCADWS